MASERILVTGANGFIGRHLCAHLRKAGYWIRAAIRQSDTELCSICDDVSIVGNIDASTVWKHAVDDVDCVLHLAARAHIIRETSLNPLEEYRRVNVHGTKQLAMTAASSGVSRLVYFSSIAVNGNITTDRPFTPQDAPNPQNDYGRSKLEAEQALYEVSSRTNLELVIVRPPLVYGPGVGGNFLRVMNLVERGIPLPVGGIKNDRSLINLWNLSTLIERFISLPQASGNVFTPSDGEDISTEYIVQQLARGLDRKIRVVPSSPKLLKFVGRILKRENDVHRLLSPLQLDGQKSRTILNWEPAMSVADAISLTTEWYKGAYRVH